MTTDLDPTLEEAARRGIRRLADAIDTEPIASSDGAEDGPPRRRMALVAACVATVLAAAAGTGFVVTSGSDPSDVAARSSQDTATTTLTTGDLPDLTQGEWQASDGYRIPENWRTTLQVYQGSEDCGHQNVTFISMSWPPGFVPVSSNLLRLFVRDPDGVLITTFDPDADPPADLRATGLQKRDVELWYSPSDDDAIYVRLPDGTFEMWPRAEPPPPCR